MCRLDWKRGKNEKGVHASYMIFTLYQCIYSTVYLENVMQNNLLYELVYKFLCIQIEVSNSPTFGEVAHDGDERDIDDAFRRF